MENIYHITTKKEWLSAITDGKYETDSLRKVGFIHCSREHQVEGVANSLFKRKKDLVLLSIDTQKIEAQIRYEGPYEDNLYPHIYGPLNIDAVVSFNDFKANSTGIFSFN